MLAVTSGLFICGSLHWSRFQRTRSIRFVMTNAPHDTACSLYRPEMSPAFTAHRTPAGTANITTSSCAGACNQRANASRYLHGVGEIVASCVSSQRRVSAPSRPLTTRDTSSDTRATPTLRDARPVRAPGGQCRRTNQTTAPMLINQPREGSSRVSRRCSASNERENRSTTMTGAENQSGACSA